MLESCLFVNNGPKFIGVKSYWRETNCQQCRFLTYSLYLMTAKSVRLCLRKSILSELNQKCINLPVLKEMLIFIGVLCC